MIKVIVGKKGSGKTARLVELMNTMAKDENKRVVCLVRGKRLHTQIKPQIRLIDTNDYPVEDYDGFLSFLAGICSKDYDITDIYVDSISKVTQIDDLNLFSDFLEKLEPFSKKCDVNFTFILSADETTLPPSVKAYCL